MDKVKSFMTDTVLETFRGIFDLMPDSILFGSILLYFLTHNLSYGVFSIFIFEITLAHKLTSFIYTQTATEKGKEPNMGCRVGYKTARFAADRIFSKDQRPSYGVFSISAIGLYLGLAINSFSDTLLAMSELSGEYGSDWIGRRVVAYTFIAIVIFCCIILQILSGCDTKTDIVIAAIFGIITGIISFFINKEIFGIESMNFLGLPYIFSKESTGSPIYICAATP